MDIHSLETYTDLDINDFEKYNLATRRGMIPEIEPRYRYTYFAHIFNGGYSSGYYFYLWAEVLDKDAFEAFKQSSDLCDKELARSFRYDLLAQGGQKPGMEMYRKFRGADPDKTAMLKARGLWQEPVVEEPVVEEVELNEPAAVKPAFTPERKPVMRPGKPGEPIRSDIAKKPIKK
jgi:peptidyl-dipeptidase Dcp